MSSRDRLLLLALSAGVLALAPATAPAAPPAYAAERPPAGVAPAGGATADDDHHTVDASTADIEDVPAAEPGCEQDVATPRAALGESDDPTQDDGDIPKEDGGDVDVVSTYAQSGPPTVCDPTAADAGAPAATTPARRHRAAKGPLRAVLRGDRMRVAAVALPAGASLRQELRFAPEAHASAGVVLAAGRRRVERARTVQVPLRLTPAGHNAMRTAAAGRRLTLRTTLRLRSGASHTRTEVLVLVLRRAAKR